MVTINQYAIGAFEVSVPYKTSKGNDAEKIYYTGDLLATNKSLKNKGLDYLDGGLVEEFYELCPKRFKELSIGNYKIVHDSGKTWCGEIYHEEWKTPVQKKEAWSLYPQMFRWLMYTQLPQNKPMTIDELKNEIERVLRIFERM